MKKPFKVTVDKESSFELDAIDAHSLDVRLASDGEIHVLYNNKSFSCQSERLDHHGKRSLVLINGNQYVVDVKNKVDQLADELGLDTGREVQTADIYAPMPGLVLAVNIAEDQVVSKGDQIVVLEAMKMENIIKAKTDGRVIKIHVKSGQSVDKNDLLIEFE